MMATDAFYPNNGIYPPQQCTDMVCVALSCTMTGTLAVAGDDVEPRAPSDNATENLQRIMQKLGPRMGCGNLKRPLMTITHGRSSGKPCCLDATA